MDNIFHYQGTPFSLEINIVEHGGSAWNTNNVHILRDGKEIGGYHRGYPSFTKETFHPFEINNEWYALYSAKYTCTRVAKLSETFEDWCGEDPAEWGFCPTEFYVPRFNSFKSSFKDGREFTYEVFDNEHNSIEEFLNEAKTEEEYTGTHYMKYGFLCGCVWGDDSSWKLKYIDLSKIPDKQLIIEEKFGYWELPNLPLKQCVRIMEPDHPWIVLTGTKAFNLKTGETEY